MTEHSEAPEGPAAQDCFQFIYPGLIAVQAIYVVARLGIADLVADGPKTAAELAALTRTHAGTLHRLLRAVDSIGLFREDEAGRFSNTPASEALRTDNRESILAGITLLPAPFCWRPLGEMYESVQTGQPAFDRIYGKHFFDYLAEHADDAAVFDAAMTAHHTPASISKIVSAYDFS